MAVALAAWLAALVFAGLVRAHSRRGVLIGYTAVLVALAVACALFALLLAGFGCWEDCDDRSDKWWDSPDSWQWTGQLVLAVLGFVAAITAFVLTIRRRIRGSLVAIVSGAVFLGAWGLLIAPVT